MERFTCRTCGQDGCIHIGYASDYEYMHFVMC